MGMDPQLPANLQLIRDAVIHAHLTGTQIPPEVELLHEWLAGEGWDAFIGAESNEEVVVPISSLELGDAELRSTLGLARKAKISDPQRVQYGRERITDIIEDVGDHDFPIAHCYEMVSQDGKRALIGGIVEIQQGGSDITQWCGVFSSCDEFHEALKTKDLWTTYCLEEITDSELLALW